MCVASMFVCTHRERCMFLVFVSLFMYVYRCMSDCLQVCVTLTLTFLPHPPQVSAWSLNYSCSHVCVFAVVCVSVAPIISLLLPAPTPVLQLTCSVLGAHWLLLPSHSFPPLFSSCFIPSSHTLNLLVYISTSCSFHLLLTISFFLIPWILFFSSILLTTPFPLACLILP